MTDEQDSKRVLSRRAMLAGAGAAAVGVASGVTLGLPELAGATPGAGQNGGSIDASGASAPAELGPSAVLPQTLMLNTLDFKSINSGTYTYVVPGGVKPAAAAAEFWNCPVHLPAGTTIQKIDLYINPGGTARSFSLTRYNGTVPDFHIIASANTTNGTAVETATLNANNHVVLPSPEAYRLDNLSLGSTAALYGGAITYLPPAVPGTLVTLPFPVRVYDSRPGGTNDGPLAGGSERVVKLSGSPATPAVPAGATGALISLTLDATVGAGFLSVFANGVPFPGTSNINWFANGQIVAVTTTTFVDATAQVVVHAGGPGSTQFIIDVIGYYP